MDIAFAHAFAHPILSLDLNKHHTYQSNTMNIIHITHIKTQTKNRPESPRGTVSGDSSASSHWHPNAPRPCGSGSCGQRGTWSSHNACCPWHAPGGSAGHSTPCASAAPCAWHAGVQQAHGALAAHAHGSCRQGRWRCKCQ